ncbi:MAG TPA: class I SAM-dependent methyltransferase [Gammaproteobacteria bacterium]|nr:class I SAM-dependent methyltransferase [Gammaproteobacteria bacterium]
MPSVEQHYDQVLSDVYAWMQGGFDAALARNAEFFAKRGIAPRGSRIAIDLGAGCGFQSIPLAKLGFAVTAIDVDRKLLDELRAHAADLDIAVVQADLMTFDEHVRHGAELVVCMVDTLLHLHSPDTVRRLFAKVQAALEAGGRFILTFRDLSHEARELDRFIPVRSDDRTIFTCFLEYEPHTVKVHDLVYRKWESGWTLHKSFYRKLRLSQQWVTEQLASAGFARVDAAVDRGLVTVIATR